jgi:ribosomal protein S18 acetylase RimI-like enzyme
VWDLNNLRVEREAGVTPEELADDAERLQGEAGLAHRRLVILDERFGAALADGFAALGWRGERFLYMVRRRSSEREADLARVEEVPWEALGGIRAEIARAEPRIDDEETVRQLREATRRVAQAGNARHFAVVSDGQIVASADLYSDGGTAQVEDVATLPDHRGRGYASAVVLGAVAEADRGGHDFVFLIADDDDWPKHLYRRLGFDDVGRKWVFSKAPDGAGGAGA